MKSKLKVLALFDATEPTVLNQDLSESLKTDDRITESDVLNALRGLGHTAEYQALYDDFDLLGRKLHEFSPDVIFNLADQFKNNRAYDQNIVSFLELHGVPFTGCGSTGLALCKNKGISKKILGYHDMDVPGFVVVPRGHRASRPGRLRYPLIVKPLKEEASLGISQSSLVNSDEQFRERVQFVHDKFDHDAIAEEYVEGRELYVSLLGNRRFQIFPIRELVFADVPPGEPRIATYKAKWDEEYRQRWGLRNGFAEELTPSVVRDIERICRRVCGLLSIDGYARIDLRLTPDNRVFFIEANPNPMLASGEDFAQSALKAGLTYPSLINQILRTGLRATRD